MISNETLSRFREVIDPYVTDKSLLNQLKPDANLIKDLKINSARIIDIVLDVEEKFNIEIDDESIGRMQTVGSAIDVISSKLVLV